MMSPGKKMDEAAPTSHARAESHPATKSMIVHRNEKVTPVLTRVVTEELLQMRRSELTRPVILSSSCWRSMVCQLNHEIVVRH